MTRRFENTDGRRRRSTIPTILTAAAAMLTPALGAAQQPPSQAADSTTNNTSAQVDTVQTSAQDSTAENPLYGVVASAAAERQAVVDSIASIDETLEELQALRTLTDSIAPEQGQGLWHVTESVLEDLHREIYNDNTVTDAQIATANQRVITHNGFRPEQNLPEQFRYQTPDERKFELCLAQPGQTASSAEDVDFRIAYTPTEHCVTAEGVRTYLFAHEEEVDGEVRNTNPNLIHQTTTYDFSPVITREQDRLANKREELEARAQELEDAVKSGAARIQETDDAYNAPDVSKVPAQTDTTLQAAQTYHEDWSVPKVRVNASPVLDDAPSAQELKKAYVRAQPQQPDSASAAETATTPKARADTASAQDSLDAKVQGVDSTTAGEQDAKQQAYDAGSGNDDFWAQVDERFNTSDEKTAYHVSAKKA